MSVETVEAVSAALRRATSASWTASPRARKSAQAERARLGARCRRAAPRGAGPPAVPPVLELRERCGVLDERDRRLGVLDDVAALLGRAVRVDARRARARPRAVARLATNHSGRLPARITMPPPGSSPERDERAGGPVHGLAVLAPARALPGAVPLARHRRALRVGARPWLRRPRGLCRACRAGADSDYSGCARRGVRPDAPADCQRARRIYSLAPGGSDARRRAQRCRRPRRLGSAAPCAAEPADLVLLNATVHTVDAERPRAEAVAVRGNRIAAVGTSAEIRGATSGRARGSWTSRGRTVVPGFDDAHAHFLGIGFGAARRRPRGDRDLRRRRRAGREGRQGARAGRVDPRPGLARGEVDGARARGRARLPDARGALGDLPRQPRGARARGRPRRARQREGDGALRHHARHARSRGRRDHPRRGGRADGRLRRQRASASSRRRSAPRARCAARSSSRWTSASRRASRA